MPFSSSMSFSDLLVLLDDLLPLEGGQPAQLHVEDGPGLDLGEVQPAHQRRRGRRRRSRPGG